MMYPLIKRAWSILKKFFKRYYGRSENDIYISFGENCLPDHLLDRYGLKSFTTPYSHGRSNIEYINAIEKDDFAHFLEKDYLKYCECNGKNVVRNFYYIKLNNIYEDSVMKGFEFTHHDVISSERCRAQFRRRIKRIKEIRNKNLYIFYHNRLCTQTNEKQLLNQLYNLYTRYSEQNNNVFVILFSQIIVEDREERKVVYEFKDGIHIFRFYTLEVWASNGINDDVFWAKTDDDLVCKMMNFIQEKKLGTCTDSINL